MPLAHDEQGRAARPRRLLLVDDHADTRDVLARLLSREFTVRTAGCYDSALAAADDFAPDVVVTDIGLPGRDGIALMRGLRDRHGISGVAVTGHAIEDAETLRAAGFIAYLQKPIRLDNLLEAVHDACGATAN